MLYYNVDDIKIIVTKHLTLKHTQHDLFMRSMFLEQHPYQLIIDQPPNHLQKSVRNY